MRNTNFRSSPSLIFSRRRNHRGGLWLIPGLLLGTGAIYGAFQLEQHVSRSAVDQLPGDPWTLPLKLPDKGAALMRDQPLVPEQKDIAVGDERTPRSEEITLDDILPAPAMTPRPRLGLEATVATPLDAQPSGTRPAASSGRSIVHEIKPGDTLSKIFNAHGLGQGVLNHILRSDRSAARIARRLRPGQVLRFRLDGRDRLLELVYEMAPTKKIRVSLDGDGMSAAVEERAPKIRISEITGIIESSLFESARRAGLSDRLILDLAQIFAWDIDFALEIRAGDRFSVLYAERWLDGKRLGDGPILAAEFANQGKVYQAVRFEDPSGAVNYYSPDGKSMRKAFLRAPVDFRRISSHFQRERWHPVLGKKRPHRGVDYAAATGTPVSASGDGKVVFIGTKSGYGKTIILQHGRKYSTLYAHLNGYRKGLKKGSRVRQGETIGYVGRTGVATGPHLHYEFRVGGVHRNPLTVISPDADPIPKRHLGAFKQASAPLLERLEDMSRTMVAGAR